jgi:hypothetical protein
MSAGWSNLYRAALAPLDSSLDTLNFPEIVRLIQAAGSLNG